MGIRNKAILVIAIVLFAMGAVLLSGAGWLANRVASQSETADMQQALDRSEAGLAQDGKALKIFVADWAQWDDTYSFVAGTRPSYSAQDLNLDSLKTVDVDFILVTNTQGKIVASIAKSPWTGTLGELPAGLADYLAQHPAITRMRSLDQSMTGLIGLPGGPALISAAPVTNSALNAPVSGTLIAGRFITSARAAVINSYTLVPMQLESRNATLMPSDFAAASAVLDSGKASVLTPQPDGKIAGYTYVPGADGSPAAMIRVMQPRTSVDTARIALTQFSLAAVVLVLGFLLILSVVIDVVVLARLRKLKAEVALVGHGGDPAARVVVDGSDEVTDVAETVNSMLGELEASQSDLAYLASHDPLTRLYNRRRFESELNARLASRRATGALLWFDLDHFKEVNDSLGHAAGDELLSQLADLLSEESRGYCHLARLGGDEFGMLIPNADEAEAVATANRILELMTSRSFAVADNQVRIGASVGIVTFPANGETADDLLARADLAMYHAKSSGRNRVMVYTSDEEWRTEMTERIGIAAAIVTALREDRFVLFAQPTRSMLDGSPGAFELLLRMHGDDGEIVMPDQIIPTAERIGLIRDIDRWVIKRALNMLAAETAAGRDTRFNVNLSGAAFSDLALLGIVKEALAESEVDPSRLTIEITETSAISDIQHAQRFMSELKALGCRFALDDFGSGVSSFFYLKHLPVDDLKIDGSLIRNLVKSETDAHFLKAIVEMCKGLKIRTVAEYVEDDALVELVRDLGVDYAQGYAIGYPLPFEPGQMGHA